MTKPEYRYLVRRLSDGWYADAYSAHAPPIWQSKPTFFSKESVARSIYKDATAWARVKFSQWGDIELIQIALHDDCESKVLEKS